MLTCPKCAELNEPHTAICRTCGDYLLPFFPPRRTPADDARYEVSKAIRAGILVRGVCAHAETGPGGCNLPIEGHHEDYAKPLDVIWLCGWHHRQLHAARRQLIREETSA
jgi:hypothetical protein